MNKFLSPEECDIALDKFDHEKFEYSDVLVSILIRKGIIKKEEILENE